MVAVMSSDVSTASALLAMRKNSRLGFPPALRSHLSSFSLRTLAKQHQSLTPLLWTALVDNGCEDAADPSSTGLVLSQAIEVMLITEHHQRCLRQAFVFHYNGTSVSHGMGSGDPFRRVDERSPTVSARLRLGPGKLPLHVGRKESCTHSCLSIATGCETFTQQDR